ncbi:Spo0B domain-containing protein [Oceanobacillus timonensis]|uniref:Spo0B domain-containing protein n=1 Tax=Oceanobacillus timonensis TaxID=1926285 RepID=UPI0009BABB22|nr:Spo0B domain-containing protein [Oceanobacillus timonensis]
MEEKETVRLLQKYRHDLMNRLQIVSGYLSMERTDKAKQQLDEVLQYYEEERKLMRLNADTFMIWVLQFQDEYPSFALTYHVDLLETAEKSIDEQELLFTCETLLAVLTEAAEAFRVYDLFLHVVERTNDWSIRMNIKDLAVENAPAIEKRYGISVTIEKEQTSFEWNIAKEERGE